MCRTPTLVQHKNHLTGEKEREEEKVKKERDEEERKRGERKRGSGGECQTIK